MLINYQRSDHAFLQGPKKGGIELLFGFGSQLLLFDDLVIVILVLGRASSGEEIQCSRLIKCHQFV